MCNCVAGAVLQEHSERFQVGESYRKRAELEAEAEAKLSELQVTRANMCDGYRWCAVDWVMLL